MVSDDPNEKIRLKKNHAVVVNNTKAINAEMGNFKDIPAVRELDTQQIIDNYYQVKQDISMLIEQEVYKLEIKDEELDEL